MAPAYGPQLGPFPFAGSPSRAASLLAASFVPAFNTKRLVRLLWVMLLIASEAKRVALARPPPVKFVRDEIQPRQEPA
jgi:hypothetical protein